MDLPIEALKAIYRTAVDPRASDAEGDAWWCSVAADIVAVIRAENTTAAGAVIAWWHHDWNQVSDTAKAAAARIRRAARAHKIK